MCESKGRGARSGCVISGLGTSSASMVRECGQPDGGERGGSGQGVAAASYLFRGGAANARRCSGGGGEGAWASCPAPREMVGGGGGRGPAGGNWLGGLVQPFGGPPPAEAPPTGWAGLAGCFSSTSSPAISSQPSR